jgi:hypothetical protein
MGILQDRSPENRQRLQPVLVGTLCCVGLLTLLVLVPGRQPVPVAMSNDRDGRALIPSGLLQPGERHSARVTLGNDGILPFSYSVSSEGSGSGSLRLTVQHATDGRLLYQGVLDGSEHQVGLLAPRERINLSVTLDLPKDYPSGPVPANVTFVWTARATLLVWWWLWTLPIIFMILAILVVSQSRRRPPAITARRRVA